MPSPLASRIAVATMNNKMSCEAIERGSVRFENIANTANRVDELRLKWVVYFRAQSAHHDVNHVSVSFESDSPHMLCNLSARDHVARRADQVCEQEKLLWRQVKRNARARCFMPLQIK